MNYLLAASVVILVVGVVAYQYSTYLRMLRQSRLTGPEAGFSLRADRYRPMLRLLSEDDLRFVSANPVLLKKMRAERREMFRTYLRCLTKDYGKLLSGIRLSMVESGVDRPDLTRALATNRVLFASTVLRVQLRLMMHAAGLGTVDVAGLVNAIEGLRVQAATFAALPAAA